MALYGLSVFLETGEHLRKGRRRYITLSFVITALSTLSASVDMAKNFQILFQSTSARHWDELMSESYGMWEQPLSTATEGCLILIGDALLVSMSFLVAVGFLMDHMPQVYRCYMMCIEYWWVAILPGMTSFFAGGASCCSNDGSHG